MIATLPASDRRYCAPTPVKQQKRARKELAISGQVLLKRFEIHNELPPLLHRQAGPRWHAVRKITLAQKPLQIAVCCAAQAIAAQ
jgi:hypothetical protein